MTRYISFCGTFEVPENEDELETAFPETYQVTPKGREFLGFRSGLSYQQIYQKDSLYVYVAQIDGTTGHLVADCSAAGWVENTFVTLEAGQPVRAVVV